MYLHPSKRTNTEQQQRLQIDSKISTEAFLEARQIDDASQQPQVHNMADSHPDRQDIDSSKELPHQMANMPATAIRWPQGKFGSTSVTLGIQLSISALNCGDILNQRGILWISIYFGPKGRRGQGSGRRRKKKTVMTGIRMTQASFHHKGSCPYVNLETCVHFDWEACCSHTRLTSGGRAG